MRHRLFLAALISVLATGVLAAVPAAAADAIWVNDDGTADPAGPGGCDQPHFNTIQEGVDAAPEGGQVRVCQGTYREEVDIDKDLTLWGVGYPQIAPPAIADRQNPDGISLVEISDAATATVVHFIIGGPAEVDSCGTYYDGVLIHEDATGVIEHNRIIDIAAEDQEGFGGCQFGTAIQVGLYNDGEPTPGHLFGAYNKITGYQKNGVVIQEEGSTGEVAHNFVDGGGENEVIARNGISFAYLATGVAEYNRVEDNDYVADPSTASTGISIFDNPNPVTIRHNILTNNDLGIDLEASEGESVVEHNVVRTSDVDGIALYTLEGAVEAEGPTTNTYVFRNQVRQSGDVGIQVDQDSVGNTIERNTSFENVRFDCEDENGDGANEWIDNNGATSNPPTICATGDGGGSAAATATAVSVPLAAAPVAALGEPVLSPAVTFGLLRLTR